MLLTKHTKHCETIVSESMSRACIKIQNRFANELLNKKKKNAFSNFTENQQKLWLNYQMKMIFEWQLIN